MTITLKNVPRALHLVLKRQAKANKRSLNQDLIKYLEEKADAGTQQKALTEDQKGFHKQIVEFREKLAVRGFRPMTSKQLKAAIEEGRE